jgi:hypothetical protein
VVGQIGTRGENVWQQVLVVDNKQGIDHVPIRHLTMVARIAGDLDLTVGHVQVS